MRGCQQGRRHGAARVVTHHGSLGRGPSPHPQHPGSDSDPGSSRPRHPAVMSDRTRPEDSPRGGTTDEHPSPTPWTPRNGHTLVVGVVARISGCANQKELSLDDQVDHAKQVVAELYDGPVEYRVIATKGKGEAARPPRARRDRGDAPHPRARRARRRGHRPDGPRHRGGRGSAASPSTTAPASSPPTTASTPPRTRGRRT